eukprot:GEMP01053739.1.p1 GENE.GEMP01053739.1~~GEMP01053739.1.p1  ORF type:complete len:174 (+),score=40.18 GEMP01053739.1:561-1082(+)
MLSGGGRTQALRLGAPPRASLEEPSLSNVPSDDGRTYFSRTGLTAAPLPVSDTQSSWFSHSDNPIQIRSRARSLEQGAVERGWAVTDEERARSAQQWFTESGNQSLDLNGDLAARSYPSGVSEKPSPRSTQTSPRLSLSTNRVAWFCFLTYEYVSFLLFRDFWYFSCECRRCD